MNIPKNNQKEWDVYRELELAKLKPILIGLGYALSDSQMHVIGERFLMSGKKLVLSGVRISDNSKVIIKGSSDAEGREELKNEHRSRETIKHLSFSYKMILLPEELLYKDDKNFTVIVSSFVEEKKGFLEYELKDQFFLAMRSFEMLEGVHATAHSHMKAIEGVWQVWGAKEYQASYDGFLKNIFENQFDLYEVVLRAKKFLTQGDAVIDQYSGFLTHTDFVPHNLRVTDKDVYLLDHTSFHFGNKYEAPARFLNYLTIYNSALEKVILEYYKKNRTTEEYLALRLMRVYKIGFLLQFYTGSLKETEGNLRKLTEERIDFWKSVMLHIVANQSLPEEMVNEYKKKRDALRSDEEKTRQKELHQI